MSSVSQNAEKMVKSPVESKNDCEVSSSSKTNDLKSLQNLNVEIKENTEITKTALQKSKSPVTSLDNSKMTESKQRTDNKTNSEQNNRNPLTESVVATVSNNDSNRNMSAANENKSPKTSSTNAQNEANNNNNSNNNNNNPKLRARIGQNNKKSSASSPTQSMPACGWCMDHKPNLKYILPTQTGENLLFCTENCIAEFRKAVKRGACKQCGNAVRPAIAPSKEYCSTFCMNKAIAKNGNYDEFSQKKKIENNNWLNFSENNENQYCFVSC